MEEAERIWEEEHIKKIQQILDEMQKINEEKLRMSEEGNVEKAQQLSAEFDKKCEEMRIIVIQQPPLPGPEKPIDGKLEEEEEYRSHRF